jgi:hypothetical protein
VQFLAKEAIDLQFDAPQHIEDMSDTALGWLVQEEHFPMAKRAPMSWVGTLSSARFERMFGDHEDVAVDLIHDSRLLLFTSARAYVESV